MLRRLVILFIIGATQAVAGPQMFSGWESRQGVYPLGEWNSGDVEIVSCPRRSGAVAMRARAVSSDTAYTEWYPLNSTGTWSTSPAASTLGFTFWFRWALLPSADTEPIAEFGSSFNGSQRGVRIDSSGTLHLYEGASTLLGSGTATLSADTWYRISFASNGTDAWEIKIDGATDASGTDAIPAWKITRIGKSWNRNGESVDFYYDDAVAYNTYTHGTTERVWLLPVNGDGTYTAWSGGDYLDLDDTPGQPAYDGDLTIVTTSTLDARQSTAHADSGSVPSFASVLAVKGLTWHRGTANGLGYTMNVFLKDDGGDVDLADKAFIQSGTAYTFTQIVASETSPTSLDAMQVGIRARNTSGTRTHVFTATELHVLGTWTEPLVECSSTPTGGGAGPPRAYIQGW
jgi:hypothetical protein